MREGVRQGVKRDREIESKSGSEGVLSILTYGCYDGESEVESPSKLPLGPGLVRNRLDDVSPQVLEVVHRHVVLDPELPLFLEQGLLLGLLELRLERVKDGGADQQVGEGTYDQRQGPDVLFLHCKHTAAEGWGGQTCGLVLA